MAAELLRRLPLLLELLELLIAELQDVAATADSRVLRLVGAEAAVLALSADAEW